VRRKVRLVIPDELAKWLDTYAQARNLPRSYAMQVILERPGARLDPQRRSSLKHEQQRAR
jgi:hypothetical protein